MSTHPKAVVRYPAICGRTVFGVIPGVPLAVAMMPVALLVALSSDGEEAGYLMFGPLVFSADVGCIIVAGGPWLLCGGESGRGDGLAVKKWGKEFTLNPGQVNTNLPNIMLVSSCGYPNPHASFLYVGTDEMTTVEKDGVFCCGEPPSAFRLVYADPEVVVLLQLLED